ncbi:MAG TPA: 30S ribosomal protein S9 [Candidatus Polarisedimenticolaceae bacterium]|nr:30S ribosomal protein S9 [Candidatus Polarisedimenticolaceae bacterium]
MAENQLQYYGTGRRKTSTARVFLRPGTGTFQVNGRSFDQYFPNETLKMLIRQPLAVTETTDKFDLVVRVDGGGVTGQAGALRHGIARALVSFSPELRPRLKESGFLTRDPREVERKKYGRPGARKRFQFSKR